MRIIDNIDLIKASGKASQFYPNLVDELIREKYSISRVEAITNNYLDDMTNEEHLNEFKELQDYRKSCKAKAKQLLGID